MAISIFRRVYLVLGGTASGVAIATAAASFFEPTITVGVPIIGALLGLGLAAFGGAFHVPERDASAVEYDLSF